MCEGAASGDESGLAVGRGVQDVGEGDSRLGAEKLMLGELGFAQRGRANAAEKLRHCPWLSKNVIVFAAQRGSEAPNLVIERLAMAAR